MFCKKCGNKIEGKVIFCGKCGDKIENDGEVFNTPLNNEKPKFPKSIFVGRIGRCNFFLGRLFALLPFFIITSLWGLIAVMASIFNFSADTSSLYSLFDQLVVFLIAISVIIYFIFNFSLLIRRSHDCGYTGWLSILACIPYIGFIVVLVLLFMKGEVGRNKYGLPSPKGRKFIDDIFNK